MKEDCCLLAKWQIAVNCKYSSISLPFALQWTPAYGLMHIMQAALRICKSGTLSLWAQSLKHAVTVGSVICCINSLASQSMNDSYEKSSAFKPDSTSQNSKEDVGNILISLPELAWIQINDLAGSQYGFTWAFAPRCRWQASQMLKFWCILQYFVCERKVAVYLACFIQIALSVQLVWILQTAMGLEHHKVGCQRSNNPKHCSARRLCLNQAHILRRIRARCVAKWKVHQSWSVSQAPCGIQTFGRQIDEILNWGTLCWLLVIILVASVVAVVEPRNLNQRKDSPELQNRSNRQRTKISWDLWTADRMTAKLAVPFERKPFNSTIRRCSVAIPKLCLTRLPKGTAHMK